MAIALSTKKLPKAEKLPAEALYLYGITRESGKRPAAEGVDGAAHIEALPCAGLVCWISRVSRPEFADRLAHNMEDLEWLATASVRHQRVVGEIARTTSILPARFGTVFLSEASLAKHVAERKRPLLAGFKRVEDADEWGVKVFAVARATAPVVHAVSGAEYLRRKAAAMQATAKRAPSAEVRSLEAALQRIAVESAAGGKVSGGQRGLEWQASFLVRRSRQKQWRAILERYAKRWRNTRRIECTGPWPPYSFASTHAV